MVFLLRLFIRLCICCTHFGSEVAVIVGKTYTLFLFLLSLLIVLPAVVLPVAGRFRGSCAKVNISRFSRGVQMQRSLIATLQHGVRYSQSWPIVNELNSVFPENKIIRLTNLAQQVLPALSVLSLVIQLQWMGQSYLAPALASALFMLSLPLQGWYWLGKRADAVLPPAMLHWYLDIADKMQQQGIAVPRPAAKPCYADLAALLSLALRQLDKTFIRQWL